MVRKAGKHQISKQAGSDLCLKVLDPAHLLFYAHWLCVNNIITMFLLFYYFLWAPLFVFCQVLWSVNSPNNQQKHTTKNLTRFPNYFPQLTMVRRAIRIQQSQRLNYAFTLSYLILRSQGLKRTKKTCQFSFLFEAFGGLVRETASKGASGKSNPNTKTYARDRWTWRSQRRKMSQECSKTWKSVAAKT